MERTLRLRGSLEAEARNSGHVRRLNLHRMLVVAMDRLEPFTRAEIVQATGLSVPTVGTLSEALLKAGLLRDVGVGPSRGGRRPSFLEFESRYAFVVGVALGATRTYVAVADLRGERLAHRIMTTPTVGPERLLGQLARWVRVLLREARVPKEKLLAAAIGVPGAVDRETGTVVLTPNLKGWNQVPVAEMLGRALPTHWTVENDVNLAILGERWRGAAQGHDTCAFIHVGTGIGAGVMVEGHLHRGHHSLAGEIGLMCMGPQHVEVDYGSRGCLETLAGVSALASRWAGKEKDDRGERLSELFKAAEAGDRRARRLVAEAGTLIGIATANLALVLDPSLVVFGGALVARGQSFLDEIRRVVGRIIPEPPALALSKLGREAALWGSLLVATTQARAHLRDGLNARRPSS
jgi:predicted NBD/HSP70 family sugar kinase